MCGIFGGINVPSSWSADRSLLHHRGPDDFGTASFSSSVAEISLSQNRLSILDLSAAGRQPMATPDGRFVMVYNGEIYNYLELRKELEEAGWEFRSRTDSEVLLYGYAQWGREVLKRLTGMFAFAILDRRHDELFLARDQFGIKPLFFVQNGSMFAFASEIKALLRLQIERKVNPRKLFEYLRFGTSGRDGETLFAGISQLPPATALTVPCGALSGIRQETYWHPAFVEPRKIPFGEAAEQLRELFLHSIRIHLRSDVPVGAALSGGIDSSAVVTALRHLEPRMELHTFSYVADERDLSEEKWMDIVGSRCGAIMHKVRPNPSDVIDDLDKIITAQDEPFSSTSIYAQYRLFRLAREKNVPVVLSGQGADELLGGYTPYLSARLSSLLRDGRMGAALRFIAASGTLPGVSKKSLALMTAARLAPPSVHEAARVLASRRTVPRWLDERWFLDRGVKPEGPNRFDLGSLREELRFALQNGLRTLLRYEDRNSMVSSIESRVPFLTTALADFLYSLPEEYLIDGQARSKSVFREAMRGIVPDEILDRKDKIGFGTTERRWLDTERTERILRSERAAEIPVFAKGALLREWEKRDGRFDFRFWRWINVIRWSELYSVEF